MRPDHLTVFVVDDDPSVRDALALMLGLSGYRTALFSDAESFLGARQQDWAGCLVADLRLPGASGIELQGQLAALGVQMPVVIITAHGDIASARSAFHGRAIDFLQKPFEPTQLLAAVEAAFAREEQRLQGDAARAGHAQRLDRLTLREREVLQRVAEGLHAKEVAARLGISPRTVEVHKARIMEKVGARNVAELVRFALGATGPAPPPAAGREPDA